MNRTCTQCSAHFEITDSDLVFYDKVSPIFNGKKELISPPTLCPACRQQRRMAFRNERHLYHRKCDLTGKQIISIISPDKPYIVYNHKDWYDDAWDPRTYGKDFNFEESFFAQFNTLLLAVPTLSINLQAENVNSDYTNYTTANRNCYLIFASGFNEDCYYCTFTQDSRNIVDSLFVFNSERCYECLDCYKGYNLRYCQNVENCSDSSFLHNCKGCKNCFGCVNLINQEYCIFNEPQTKEVFASKMAELHARPDLLEIARKKVTELRSHLPQKFYAGIQNEEVSGDHVSFSKNATNCFDCTYLEDCKNCIWLHRSKDCQDCYAWGYSGELGYENHLCGKDFYNCRFCNACWDNVSNLLYCQFCMQGCKDCFGCIGLKHAQYCILNKQYTKDEYEALVPRIIEKMRTDHEWGEFFPASHSPYGYNETVAQEYFPLTEEEAKNRGLQWHHEEDDMQKYLGPSLDIPAHIEDVTDDICQKVLTCEVTGKPYKIIPQELKFYRMMSIPVPRRCFDQRHKERMQLRNPRTLWNRTCAKCQKAISTSYSPDRPEIIYCEDCYLSTVY